MCVCLYVFVEAALWVVCFVQHLAGLFSWQTTKRAGLKWKYSLFSHPERINEWRDCSQITTTSCGFYINYPVSSVWSLALFPSPIFLNPSSLSICCLLMLAWTFLGFQVVETRRNMAPEVKNQSPKEYFFLQTDHRLPQQMCCLVSVCSYLISIVTVTHCFIQYIVLELISQQYNCHFITPQRKIKAINN